MVGRRSNKMASANPSVDYKSELASIREMYVLGTPQVRLNVINNRLNEPEIGAVKLVTIVSCIEALVRSLVVHLKAQNKNEIQHVYEKHRNQKPESLVEEYLKHNGCNDCSSFYQDDTWVLFQNAVKFRNLIVHECTYLGQDKYPSLISACGEVLDSLIKLGKLTARENSNNS